jgi:2-polyprenyl-3-methyl-5-hydroxy-6-metoxy-1,4-benzoquinol methylase
MINESKIHEYAQNVIAFLHEPLSVQITGGIHVNDAFIYDSWAKLPSEWTKWWDSLPSPQHAQKDLINSLRTESEAPEEQLPCRPDSLSQWLERIRNLSLNRDQLLLNDNIPAITVPESMASRMVTKKLAEVRAGARYINHICKRHNITRVIDMGSGQGHLSLTLASTCALKVLAIDGNPSQIQGSRTAAQQAALKEGHQITHLCRFVTQDSIDLANEITQWAAGEKCLLTGLHACGSLSENMLRLFTSINCITQLAVVGCCYNHITPLSATQPTGFPISAHMRKNKLRLSTSALITGCQAPTNWLHNPNSIFSRKHFYRAVLEKLIHDKQLLHTRWQDQSSQPTRRPVWAIRNGDLKDFETYCSRALQSLKLTIGKDVTVGEMREYEDRYSLRMAETAILWTLSVLLCRVVESAIALDRVFFLRESDDVRGVDVVAIFDYKVSPRNLMIVAAKGELNQEKKSPTSCSPWLASLN